MTAPAIAADPPALSPLASPSAPAHREPRWRRRTRRFAWFLLGLAVFWVAFSEYTLIRPPRNLAAAPVHALTTDALGTRHYGRSYFRRHGGVWEMGLVGDPIELGDAHARLIRDVMFRVEAHMMALYAHYVPSAALRQFITTLVRARHLHLDRNYPPERIQEMAAEARAFAPTDPYASFLPTYHRIVTLHALYDIALSFEHSPLIGCSALFASGAHSVDGHTYVGRNFDMEIDPAFDIDKTVVLFRPRGRIAFASVAWPGLTGVVTGMNLAGIFVAVHGARASEPSTEGVPVPTTLRTILERAHTLEEAIAIARADAPMVSHLLIIVDGDHGTGAVVERAPGRTPFVHALGTMAGISNHFASPLLAADAKNQAVRENTSTLARQSRLDTLVGEHDGRFDPAAVLEILRDRRGPGDAPEPLGHRGTLDPWIATHSVIADATARVLWVSASPHTLGHYERFDLRRMLADEYQPSNDVDTQVLPADPALTDGLYQRWLAARTLIAEGTARLGHHDPAGALDRVDRALAGLPEGDMDALHLRARALSALGRREQAVDAWRRYLQAAPPSPAEANEARSALATLGAPVAP